MSRASVDYSNVLQDEDSDDDVPDFQKEAVTRSRATSHIELNQATNQTVHRSSFSQNQGYVPPTISAPNASTVSQSDATLSSVEQTIQTEPAPSAQNPPSDSIPSASAPTETPAGSLSLKPRSNDYKSTVVDLFKGRAPAASPPNKLHFRGVSEDLVDAEKIALRRPDALREEVFHIDLLEGNKHLNKDEWLKLSRLNSLNYHLIDNELRKSEMNRLTSSWHFKVDTVQRWIIAFLIGLVTGFVAFGIHISIEMIEEEKFSLKNYLVLTSGVQLTSLMMLIMNYSIVLPGTLLVIYFANAANSSGIPFVKSYQNGILIPQAFNLKTLITKIIGCISAVSSNMPVGPEGPMIHIGGMIGGGVSQSRSKTLGCTLPFLKKFRNDHDRRDFIATGSACGVAAAFSAPIGGCLFAMEETSSFWSHAITWRTLFSCIISAFVVDFMIAHSTSATSNAPDSLTHVAVFQVQGSTQATYFLWELVPFSILAVIGGLLGAAFIQLNSFATSYRIRMIGTRPLYRVLEVLFWVTLWTFMTHYSPYLVQCQQKPDVASQNWETGLLLEWTCDPNQYNGLASLLSISQTNALRSLLKQNALTDFTPGTLAVFMVIYFFGAALIAGSSLVSGLMVPFLVIGATYGRLMGLVIKSMSFGAAVEPGLYALIGATSFFGGVSRMTISLSVIILEITGNMALLLPIMLTAMISKWIGDLFSHSLYDILIHVQSIPFLESEPAPIFNILDVSQVMSRGVKQFTSIVSVREVIEMLTTHTHEGFPVVESKKHPRLRGLILRIQLLVLLDARIWQSPRPEIPFDEFQTRMMNFKQTIDQMEFEPEDLDCTFDLSPFYNQSPFSVHSGFLLTLAFRLFRTMGLRHLPVVDERNYVVGIITRKDLLDAVVEAKHDVLMRKHNLGTGFRKVLAEISERSSQQHRQDIVAPL